jgi:PEP-CTERM motif
MLKLNAIVTATLLAVLGLIPNAAHGVPVLMNGATDTRLPAFPTFLDNTLLDTQAWGFAKGSNHTLLAGGELSSVDVIAVGPTGGAGITISNSENGGIPRVADINGYTWGYGYGGADLAERDALANDGGGIWSLGGDLTISIPVGIVPEGRIARVELLAIGALAPVRVMDVMANGVPYVENWDVREGIADHWNSVLEFDAVGDASGLTLVVSGGTDPGDHNPYIHALSVTVLPVPEPGTAALAGLGMIALGLRRRRAA